jgi:lauroyl/myristoyl acyltransferase
MATLEPAPRPAPHRTLATWTSHALNTGLFFNTTYRLVRALPGGLCHGMARFGTSVAHRLMRDTRAALADNFRGAFPELDDRAIADLTRRTFHSYAADGADFFRSVELPTSRALALFDRPEPPEEVFGSQLALGRGVILVAGHFGNWEMGSVFMRARNLPLTIVAMREASEEINRLRVDFRRRLGADTLEVRQSIDTALQIRRRLAENRIVAMLMDRHVGRDRVAVSFFGRTAFFLRTPALIGYMTGAPLLPCSVVRVGPDRFRVRPGRPIIVSRESDRDVAVQQAAQDFASQLEALIRERPYCWYQFYPYWQAQRDAALEMSAA